MRYASVRNHSANFSDFGSGDSAPSFLGRASKNQGSMFGAEGMQPIVPGNDVVSTTGSEIMGAVSDFGYERKKQMAQEAIGLKTERTRDKIAADAQKEYDDKIEDAKKRAGAWKIGGQILGTAIKAFTPFG